MMRVRRRRAALKIRTRRRSALKIRRRRSIN